MSCWWTASYYEDGETYPSYRYASDEALEATRGSPSQVLIDAAKYKRPCIKPHGHDESDLCAQWRAAKAAERAALWGLVQMVLSAFGVVGLAVTLWYNRNALKLAGEANAVSQRNGEAQVRCYLSVVEGRVKLSGNVPLFQVKVKNAGQSPAKAVVASYGFSPDIGYEFTYDTLQMIPQVEPEDIPAQEAVWLAPWHPPTPLTPEEANAWRSKVAAPIALMVELRGADVFGHPVSELGYFLNGSAGLGTGAFHELTPFASGRAEASAQVMQFRLEGILDH
jgi:hypothetical protein